MGDSESKDSRTLVDLDMSDFNNKSSTNSKKKSRPKNSKISNKKLNNSGFRVLALSSKFITSISPQSIVLIKECTDKYIILLIIIDIIRTITNTLDGRSSNKSKAYCILNVEKLKQIAYKHVRHDVYGTTFHTKLAFHPLSFCNYVNDKTNQILMKENNFIKLQWSSSCIGLFQQIVENELYIVKNVWRYNVTE